MATIYTTEPDDEVDEVVKLLARAESLTTDAYLVKYFGSKGKYIALKREEEEAALDEEIAQEHPNDPVRLALARVIADKIGVSYEVLDEQIKREGG